MNETKLFSLIYVFHYLARDVYRAHILKKGAVCRPLIHEKLQLGEIMYGSCFD